MTDLDVYTTMSSHSRCRFASLERERRCETFDEPLSSNYTSTSSKSLIFAPQTLVLYASSAASNKDCASRPQKMSSPPSVPPELKPITPYLARAHELATADPVIAYWCTSTAFAVSREVKRTERADDDSIVFRYLPRFATSDDSRS